MLPKIADATIAEIKSKLGDAKDYEEGQLKEGTVMGQIVEEKFGGRFFTPKIIAYRAQVKRIGGELDWEIRTEVIN